MREISLITNASDLELEVFPPSGNSFVVPAFSQYRPSPTLQIPEADGDLRFKYYGGELTEQQVSLFGNAETTWANYPSNSTAWGLPDLSPNTSTDLNLFFINRPTTDFDANQTTKAIWVIGDVDTGGGE